MGVVSVMYSAAMLDCRSSFYSKGGGACKENVQGSSLKQDTYLYLFHCTHMETCVYIYANGDTCVHLRTQVTLVVGRGSIYLIYINVVLKGFFKFLDE